MAISAATLATDMDVISAALEAEDVTPDTVQTNSTLRTATLRLAACFVPWVHKAGYGQTHQPHTQEVFVAANDLNQ